MLTQRQSEILDRIVRDYIALAEPVSSRLLEKKHDFGVSPATIRNEMQKLTDRGYLFQPHTSAGRVPTDRGYRFFVDELLENHFKYLPDLAVDAGEGERVKPSRLVDLRDVNDIKIIRK